jgi:thiol-disulfide isomerase/thioredoxin
MELRRQIQNVFMLHFSHSPRRAVTLAGWLVLLLGLGLAPQPVWAQGTEPEAGIQFHKGSWDDLLAKAKKQGKPIFVDFYASWCGPCKMMDKYVFTDPTVGAYANLHYLAAKIDCEHGEGRTLAQQYEVSAYPTLVILKPDGTVIHRMVGMRDANGLLAELAKHNPNQNLQGVSANAESMYLEWKQPRLDAVRAAWESSLPDSLLDFVYQAYQFGLKKDAFAFEDMLWASNQLPEASLWHLHAEYQRGAKQWKQLEATLEPLAKAKTLRPEELHLYAWAFGALEDVPHAAMRWINDALRLRPDDPLMLDTKAYLLYRNGKYADARETLLYLQKLCKKADCDFTGSEELLALVSARLKATAK